MPELSHQEAFRRITRSVLSLIHQDEFPNPGIRGQVVTIVKENSVLLKNLLDTDLDEPKLVEVQKVLRNIDAAMNGLLN